MYPADYLLSTHFTLKEATESGTAIRLGISNTPTDKEIEVMKKSAILFERVREYLGAHPTHIDSWFRSDAVNTAVGSKSTSQHRTGEAIDFVCPAAGTPLEICKNLTPVMVQLEIDQLILEHSWVHVSFAILNGKPRAQLLSLVNGGHYALGLTDPRGKPY